MYYQSKTRLMILVWYASTIQEKVSWSKSHLREKEHLYMLSSNGLTNVILNTILTRIDEASMPML